MGPVSLIAFCALGKALYHLSPDSRVRTGNAKPTGK
jgi:hypothetical protein